MCQFEYQQFQKCGHKGIEIIEYCNEVFWTAGLTGHLKPCPEQNYRAFFIRIGVLEGMDFGPCRWMGLSGYCKICEEEYAMPKAIPFRTYDDIEFLKGIGDLTAPIFAVKLAQPIEYPTPRVSIQFASTPNDGVTRKILDEFSKSSSPSHEATPAIRENLLTRRLRTSLHHPYIFAPYIKNTVAGLISVEDQATPNGLEELYFPAKLQWYELNQGVEGTTIQWRSTGYHEGQILEGAPSQYFCDHCGLTPADEQHVMNKLKDGVPLQIIWREKFKERGVDLVLFYVYGRKTEEMFAARGVRANSKMEKIQKELAERSQAADGIRPFGTYQQSSDNDLQPGQGAFQPMLNPSGQSLDDINQQRLRQQQTQNKRDEPIHREKHDDAREQMMQQMMRQQLEKRKAMQEKQIVRQQMVLQQMVLQQQMRVQQMHQQYLQEQMRQQMRQRMMQVKPTHNQKDVVVTVEEVEAEEAAVL